MSPQLSMLAHAFTPLLPAGSISNPSLAHLNFCGRGEGTQVARPTLLFSDGEVEARLCLWAVSSPEWPAAMQGEVKEHYLSFRLSMKRFVKDFTLSTRAP